jgi:flagellar motor switch protein FliN
VATETPTYHWLKQIPSALLKIDQKPLIGFPPPFPWMELSSNLGALLNLSNLSIKPKQTFEWRTEADLFAGMSDRLNIMNISISPLDSTLCWAMAEEDINLLMSLLITQKASPLDAIDAEFQKGFYRFLAVETIHAISNLEFDKELSAHILDNVDKPKETSLCLDVSIEFNQKNFWGRLIISPQLQKNSTERYTQRTLDVPLAQKLDLTLHLEAGRVNIKPAEWSQIALGDCILLDSCSIKPNGEGKVMMTIGGIPLFRGKFMDGNINIMELPLYNEVDEDMGTNNPEDEASLENHDLEDSTFDEEEHEDEEHTEHDEDEHASEFEEDLEEEEELEEEPSEEDNPENWPPPERRTPEPHHEAAETETAQTHITEELEPEQKTISLGEVPLNVIVEVGRLQISIQKLMELQPGNLLELNVRPEDGVDLVVNGKRIAKGELILIGEALGIRILDIG